MLEPQGLTPTILGEERFYDCFDLNFRKHQGVRWTVKYDPDDLSTALAVNDDGTLRFVLQEKYRQPMALKDRKEGDAGQLETVRDFNTGLESYITEVRSESSQKVQQLFSDVPALSDTLAKMVLINSYGQHKNERNNQRALQAAEKLNTKALQFETKKEEKNFTDERRDYIEKKVDLSKYLTEVEI